MGHSCNWQPITSRSLIKRHKRVKKQLSHFFQLAAKSGHVTLPMLRACILRLMFWTYFWNCYRICLWPSSAFAWMILFSLLFISHLCPVLVPPPPVFSRCFDASGLSWACFLNCFSPDSQLSLVTFVSMIHLVLES